MMMMIMTFFIESFPQMCFEGKWLQNRLRADKNESISLLAVDIQGHQRGSFCKGLLAKLPMFGMAFPQQNPLKKETVPNILLRVFLGTAHYSIHLVGAEEK